MAAGTIGGEMLRKQKFAGTWYPEAKKEIEKFLRDDLKKQRVIAAVCPHAGWAYSGKIAGEVFSSMEPAMQYILIGPDHHAAASAVSIFTEGTWQTPLGGIEIDNAIAQAIIRYSSFTKSNSLAHEEEHSLEVLAPFIKYISPTATIVPIIMSDYRPAVCKSLGNAISKAINDQNKSAHTVIIASSDMSHYVTMESAKETDAAAIEKILELNAAGLLETVRKNNISMCGSGPVAAAIHAAKELGASRSKLLSYATSGDTTGNYDEVVGYAGIIIY